MAVLGPGLQTLATRLLTWDRNRVARHVADGIDCTVYKARQDLAEACVALDTDAWPQEIRFFYVSLLETLRNAVATKVINLGGVATPVPRLTLAERNAFRAFADAIGMRDRMKETSPAQWGDVDTEGP